MKNTKIKPKLIRQKDVIFCGDKLEGLFTFKKFPVFIGCTNKKPSTDRFCDMIFDISRESGLIQLRNPLPLDIVYGNYHSEAIGKTWESHHEGLSEFILEHSNGNILEIGGSNGKLAEEVIKHNEKIVWTIIEPNPSLDKINIKIRLIKSSFDEKTVLGEKFPTIVHSHVLEHFYDPKACLENIYRLLESDGRQIFSVPNLCIWLRNKYPNALNFEHTLFLTEYFIDYLLGVSGFIILKKRYFKKHSIFYATEKIKTKDFKTMVFENKYSEYKKLYMDFIKYNQSLIKRLNNVIDQHDEGVYLFGAHIFSQFLINFGLHTKNIKYILDNSLLKQNKRVYGTKIFVKSPQVLKNIKRGTVILRAGAYSHEIEKQIKFINPNIKIVR